MRALALVLVLAAACATPPPGAQLVLPTVTLSRIGTLHLAEKGVYAEAEMLVENPNPFPLWVDKLDWRMTLRGHAAGVGESVGGVKVPPLGSAKVPVRLLMPPDRVLDSGLALLMEGGIPYRLDVVAHFKTPVMTFKVPVWTEGRLQGPGLLNHH